MELTWDQLTEKTMKAIFRAKINISQNACSNYAGTGQAALTGCPPLEQASANAIKLQFLEQFQNQRLPQTKTDFQKWLNFGIGILTEIKLSNCSKHFQIALNSNNCASWYDGDIATSAAFEAMRSELLLILKETLWDLNNYPNDALPDTSTGTTSHLSQTATSGNTTWKEFPVSRKLLTEEELTALRKLAQNGADFKVYFMDNYHAIFPVVRVLSHADPATVWMYCIREGSPQYTFGFAFSSKHNSNHSQCWIGTPVTVSSYDTFFTGTTGSIVNAKDITIRLFYRQ